MLKVNSASLVYQDQGRDLFACREVSLEVRENEFLGILGPSGSGKSSLLYLMSGLKTPSSGQITFDGKPLSGMDDASRANLRLKEFGFVFQQPYLLGYLSAIENVLVAQPSGGTIESATDLLTSLGLANKLHRLPHELSGGERQRVCVARALMGNPRVIFADEPTASLDHKNGVAVVNLLNDLRGKGALVMVTHDPTMLERADRIVRLVDGHISEPDSN
ncbi:SalX ABC-type antimicrobial peptide transport system, ATPase component [Fimbriimonadaceae bacterium]